MDCCDTYTPFVHDQYAMLFLQIKLSQDLLKKKGMANIIYVILMFKETHSLMNCRLKNLHIFVDGYIMTYVIILNVPTFHQHGHFKQLILLSLPCTCEKYLIIVVSYLIMQTGRKFKVFQKGFILDEYLETLVYFWK